MVIYKDMFPERYENGAFLAFHNSRTRDPLKQKGHRVVFVPINDGRTATNHPEEFTIGFPPTEKVIESNKAICKSIELPQGSNGYYILPVPEWAGFGGLIMMENEGLLYLSSIYLIQTNPNSYE